MSFQPRSVVIGVIIGLLLGVGVGYFISLPQINRLTQEKTNLQDEIISLQEELDFINNQLRRLTTQNWMSNDIMMGDHLWVIFSYPALAVTGQEFKINFTFLPREKIS